MVIRVTSLTLPAVSAVEPAVTLTAAEIIAVTFAPIIKS